MSEVISLQQQREARHARERGEVGVYYCECGSAMFRLYDDGVVECLNCGGKASGLVVVEKD